MPVTPMMPHILRSVSHATRKAREIYLSQPLHGVLDARVAQPQAQGAAALTHRAGAVRGHTELLRQRHDGGGALGRAGDDSAAVGLAEQQLYGRQAEAVTGEIDVEPKPGFLVRPSHRDLGERDAEPALRAIVRGAKQDALRAGDQEVDEPPLGAQVHAGRHAAYESVQRLPHHRAAELGPRFPQDEDDVAGRASLARYRAVGSGEQAHHPDDRRGIDGARRAFVVEGDVAPRDRRVQRLEAMAGWSSRVRSTSAGPGTRDPGSGHRARSATVASSSRASGAYTGQSSISRCPGISTTTCSFQVARYMPSSVTRPIGVAVSSHLAAVAWTSFTRSALATTSMRSCDSDSRISYGVIPGSRVGTRDRSISTPTPPFAAISADEDVSPAAPMSWIATMWLEAISSRLASSSSFSVKGSPTWTCGRRRSLACVSSSDANDAPWIPSRPVREPTTSSTLPTPCAAAVIRSASRSRPTHIALTSGLPA